MTVRRDPAGAGSLQRLAALCGVLAGVGGLMHSVGEILQGSTPPVSIVFDSWVDEPFATNLGGEPAMTLVPNLLLTGILTIVASLAVVVWSAAGTGRAGYGRVLFLLSIVMLLVGGGFAPPLIGMLAAAAGVAGRGRHGRWARRLSGRLGRALSGLWPLLSWVVLLDVFFLVAGSVILAAGFDVNAPGVFVYALFVAVAGLPAATVAAVARDVVTEGDQRSATPSGRPIAIRESR